MPVLSNILNLAGHILQKRVTENHYGQNMISLLDSQLPMMNASQRRAKYAERPSPCQSRAGYLPAARETHSCCEHFSPSPPLFLPWPLPSSDCIDLFWQRVFAWADARFILARGAFRVHAQQSHQKTGFRAAPAAAVWQAVLFFFFFYSEGIAAFGAFIMVSSHSQPSNADVSRYTGKAEWCKPTTMPRVWVEERQDRHAPDGTRVPVVCLLNSITRSLTSWKSLTAAVN